MSCTTYCNCSGKVECCNPYTVSHNVKAGNDESIEMEDVEEEVSEQYIDQEGENHEEEDVPEYLEDEWD